MYANGMATRAAQAKAIAYIVLELEKNTPPKAIEDESLFPTPPTPPPKSASVSANETDFVLLLSMMWAADDDENFPARLFEYFSARTDFTRTGASGFPKTGGKCEEDEDDDADVSTMLFTIGRMMMMRCVLLL
jgi:hypothetical protein